MQPFGRVAPFTLYADGRVFTVDEKGEMLERSLVVTQLTPEETVAFMESLWEAGYGRVESWEDMCAPGEGETPCLADAPYTVLNIRTGPEELRTTRHYGSFAPDMAALDAVVRTLGTFGDEGAAFYTPQRATLFVRWAGEANSPRIVEWPLEVELTPLVPCLPTQDYTEALAAYNNGE